jgi:AraC-like DNA-binding protein
MGYGESAPRDELRPFVEAIWTMTSRADPATAGRGTILPDGAAEIVVSCGDPIAIPPRRRLQRRVLLGPSDRVRRVIYAGAVDLVGVRLRPGVVRAMVNAPLARLVNRIVPLGSVAPSLDAKLAECVASAGASVKRRDAMQRVIESFTRQTTPPDGFFPRAIDAIRAQQGRIRIDDLASRLGVSRRHLEREFLANVGLSPKRWCRVIRFQCAVESMSERRDCDWADLAQRIGYADQAHFCREFRQFTDVPPTSAWWPRGG